MSAISDGADIQSRDACVGTDTAVLVVLVGTDTAMLVGTAVLVLVGTDTAFGAFGWWGQTPLLAPLLALCLVSAEAWFAA